MSCETAPTLGLILDLAGKRKAPRRLGLTQPRYTSLNLYQLSNKNQLQEPPSPTHFNNRAAVPSILPRTLHRRARRNRDRCPPQSRSKPIFSTCSQRRICHLRLRRLPWMGNPGHPHLGKTVIAVNTTIFSSVKLSVAKVKVARLVVTANSHR